MIPPVKPPKTDTPYVTDNGKVGPDYGRRFTTDGSEGKRKGSGFLGPQRTADGRTVMTELTVGTDLGEIPTLVPTLETRELDYLRRNYQNPQTNPQMWKGIIQKATDHAQQRMSSGQSPFVEFGERPRIVGLNTQY